MRRLIASALVMAGVYSALTGCSYRQNSSAASLPELRAQAGYPFKTVWEQSALPFSGKIFGATEKDRVYLADDTGFVEARDLISGKVLWHDDLSVKISSPPGADSKQVYLGTKNGKLYALDQKGKLAWVRNLPSSLFAAPVATGQGVLTFTHDNTVELWAADGTASWQGEHHVPALMLYNSATPTVDGDFAYVGYSDGAVAAIELSTGQTIWQRFISEPKGRTDIQRMADVVASPLVQNDLVFAVNYQGQTVALNKGNGTLVWSAPVESVKNMDANITQLFLTTSEDVLVSLEQSSGTILWRQEALKGRGLSAPLRRGNHILVSDNQGYIITLAADTGEILGYRQLTSAVSDRLLMLPCETHGLLVYLPAVGRLTRFEGP
ncbi:MAG: outer membrane protein assembly factor BamB [Pseudomonadota bacterium]